jgi:hypothetical protein
MLDGRRDVGEAEAAYRRTDERGDGVGAFNLDALLEERRDLTGAKAAYRRASKRGDAEVVTRARDALLELGRDD